MLSLIFHIVGYAIAGTIFFGTGLWLITGRGESDPKMLIDAPLPKKKK